MKKIVLLIIKSSIILNALFWIVIGITIIVTRDLSFGKGIGTLSIALIFAIAPFALYWTANKIFGFYLNKGGNLLNKFKNIFTSRKDNISRQDKLGISTNKYQQEPMPSSQPITMVGVEREKDIALNTKGLDKKIGESAEQSNIPNKPVNPSGGIGLYQILFVRSQQDRISKSMSFLFIICAVIAYFGLIFLVNPPWKFNELSVAQGVMKGYLSRDYSKRFYSELKIKNENNELVTFSINPDLETRKKIENLKGELITIYYGRRMYLFVFPAHDIWAIKNKGTYIKPYSISQYNRELALHENGKIAFIICAIICFTSLLIIYLRDRKIK